MRYAIDGKTPDIDPTAVIAPTAVISGAVTIGPRAHVSFGAVILGDESPVAVGEQTVIRENVVIRASTRHPVRIGSYVLIGARSALYGCTIDDEVFLATGVTIFHGAHVGRGAEVRVNGVVHVNTVIPAGITVPIGWVAVGDPAEVLPPGEHERIWAVQEAMDFPATAYGVERDFEGGVDMREVTGKAVVSRRPHGWQKLED
ncbi:MAG: gamma carbonic anhydrase family protein [Gemmatimonadota bacterium]|nr:MAG: gamma carbonic anhydrase family protein [Gemmatimonadota bacterium]